MVRSAISVAGPVVDGRVSSSVAPVARSAMRKPTSPVLLPGLTDIPDTRAPRARRRVSWRLRGVGAVVALTATVLPEMPSRLGSPVLSGATPGPSDGTLASGGFAV